MEEMLQSGTLSTLIKTSDYIQSNCKDHLVDKADGRSNFVYDPYNDTVKYLDREGGNHEAMFTPYSFSQLCTRLGIPVRYMDKCLEAGNRELVASNVNDWLKHSEKDLMVRRYDKAIRGILSQKYSVLDTPDILDVTQNYLKDAEIKGYFISPERFHLRAILQPLNVPNEDLFAGFQIDSSDVGRSTLMVQFFLYKQVCTNGLMVSRGDGLIFQQRHINISKDEFSKGLITGMNVIPKLIPDIERSINICMKKSMPYELITANGVQAFINDLKIHAGLGEDDSLKVAELMSTKYGDTQWSLINSLTEVSQQFTLEKRLTVERFAGNLLVA